MDGLVIVDKPPGCTSHDVVARLRRIYGQRRVGHAGTLDPSATGVLLVGLGRVTRLLRFLSESGKAYEGVVEFGRATSTLDAEGEVIATSEMSVTRPALEQAAAAMVGEVWQIPPMVSARKVGGRRLHELARAGVEVEREPRAVRITRCDVTAFDPGPPGRATIDVECGAGTYVRVLAVDLGTALGGHAHLAALRRTRQGAFGIAEARTLEAIAVDPSGAVLDARGALRHLDAVTVDASSWERLTHGAALSAALAPPNTPGPFVVCSPAGAAGGVYERRGERLAPVVVLAAADSDLHPGQTETAGAHRAPAAPDAPAPEANR